MKNYNVYKIDVKTAKTYIHKNHYSHGSHNAPSPCYGLYDENELIGVLMFATPCSENVRASVFGVERKNEVIELHRLHILDCTPKNTESWFIARCLKMLKKEKPYINAVVSFADETEGHSGVIYKATHFVYEGKTASVMFYKDVDGRLRHPRQNGVNITRDRAKELGWQPTKRLGKNRYVYYFKQQRLRHIPQLIQQNIFENEVKE